MRAFASKNPFYAPVSEKTKTGRQRLTLSRGSEEWDFTTGWHPKRAVGWKSKGLKAGNIKKVSRIAPDGRVVTVYKTSGYDDFIGYHAHEDPDQAAIDFGMNAFDESDPSHAEITRVEGCGHIELIEYAAYPAQVLRVTFKTNGAICLFFRVHSAVAGELIYLARSKSMRLSPVTGKQRHSLGIVFWDLVRIRGQHTGARYPFEYERHGNYKLTHSGKRYRVTLSDENAKLILGRRYLEKDWKAGEKVSTILSEEEYARYLEGKLEEEAAAENREERMFMRGTAVGDSNAKGEQSRGLQGSVGGVGVVETRGVATDTFTATHDVGKYKQTYAELLAPDEYARFNELEARMISAQSKADSQVGKSADGAASLSEADKRKLWAEAAKMYKDPERQADYVMNKIDTMLSPDVYDKRFKHGQQIVRKSAIHKVTPHEVFANDKAALNDYLRLKSKIRREQNAPRYADMQVGRYWTIQELTDFSNPSIPGAIKPEHAAMYKKLIKNRDYEAALNYLKSRGHEVYSNGKLIARRKYAGPHDQIALKEGD